MHARQLTVLIAEDSEDDALLVLRELRRAGYQPEHQRVESSTALETALKEQHWDLLITDHNMPGFDSFSALAIAKDYDPDIPVIITSGSLGEQLAVSAMKAGASDYLMKDNLARLGPAVDRELSQARHRRERRAAIAEAEVMSRHDALTGLLNRTEFERRLKAAIEVAQTDGAHHALMFIDLDQFKVINDTCGHVAGDQLLIELAATLRDSVREQDVVARLGGDEFAMLLQHCEDSKAEDIAGSVLRNVHAHRFIWDHKPFSVGASIGLIVIDQHAGDAGELMSLADMGCYAAKESGRNRYHRVAARDEDIQRRRNEMHWVARIRSAITNKHFTLCYQRIVHTADSKAPAFCEYLLRLRDEQGELIPPNAFIPAAERYNLMSEIDQYVVELALEHIQQLDPDGRPALAFINLSGDSIDNPEFVTYLQTRLSQVGVPPEQFCFEVTETVAVRNIANAVEFIAGIRALGCKFALDDFGSGMCSFTYLKTMPVDYVKIDGSFVANINDNPIDLAIVAAINEIAHVAGFETIAEFVENDAILDKLRTISAAPRDGRGIDHVQGFHVHRPVPIAVGDANQQCMAEGGT